MKKVFFLFSVLFSISLVSCGSEPVVEEPVVTVVEESDTTEVADDSDTTVVSEEVEATTEETEDSEEESK